jgi:SAM-dependent methyltransferase
MKASVSSLFLEFGKTPAEPVPELPEGRRKNPFLWRGQFPPEFVGSLLDDNAKPGYSVLDPFVGSGTVLLESAARGLACAGSDTNPAALELSRTYLFCGASDDEREERVSAARSLLQGAEEGKQPARTLDEDSYARIARALRKCEANPLTRNVLANAIMRMNLGPHHNFAELGKALEAHARIIAGLPHSAAGVRVVRADARRLPFEGASFDLILTSPPYINVFDYSFNYSRSAELLRWNPAVTAAHEIGSVGAANPFLAVIRYALDMRLALLETRRVMKARGRAILVVGRESKIKGVPFAGSAMVYAIAAGCCGLAMDLRQERRFTTPDGNDVVEDVLSLASKGEADGDDGLARDCAKQMLKDALERASGAEHGEILEALKEVRTLGPTPILEV